MKIAIFMLATNKYIQFVEPLCESIRKHFLVNHQVDIFVFTNHANVPNGAFKIHQDHITPAWPYMSLLRFEFFSNSRQRYNDYDYYYYCDSDTKFVSTVDEEIFGDFVVTQHPGYWKANPLCYPFEKNPQSKACVVPNENSKYFIGAFNGGKNFLNMCEILKDWVREDINNKTMPVWFDESMLNKYATIVPPDKILTPEYLYPQYCYFQNDLEQVEMYLNKINPPEKSKLWNAMQFGVQDLTPKLMGIDKNHEEIRS